MGFPLFRRKPANAATWIAEDIYRRDETSPWWTVIVTRQDHRETHVISIRIIPTEDTALTDAVYADKAKATIRALVQQSDDALQLNATHHELRACTDTH